VTDFAKHMQMNIKGLCACRQALVRAHMAVSGFATVLSSKGFRHALARSKRRRTSPGYKWWEDEQKLGLRR
jgi:hypothetical protein